MGTLFRCLAILYSFLSLFSLIWLLLRMYYAYPNFFCYFYLSCSLIDFCWNWSHKVFPKNALESVRFQLNLLQFLCWKKVQIKCAILQTNFYDYWEPLLPFLWCKNCNSFCHHFRHFTNAPKDCHCFCILWVLKQAWI